MTKAFGLIFLTILAVGASPPATADTMTDIDNLNFATDFIDFASTATICAALDYDVRQEKIKTTLENLTSDVISQASNPTSTQQMLETHSRVAFSNVSEAMSVLDVKSDDNADRYDALDSLVRRWTPACNGYATKDQFKPFIGPSPLQSAGYSASAFNFARAAAESGKSKYMLIYADMHRVGKGEPDKDHKIEFSWIKRAASTGEADAAYTTAGNYATGYGTAKDNVEAEKWWRIALAMGYEDKSTFPIFEKKMTAADIAAGKAAAHAWLVENEYE